MDYEERESWREHLLRKSQSAGSVLNLENGSTITLAKTEGDEPITGNGVYWFQD